MPRIVISSRFQSTTDCPEPGEKATDEGAIDIRDGGTAIPYWDEDPFIRQEYEQILKDGGVPSQMDPSLYVDPLKT